MAADFTIAAQSHPTVYCSQANCGKECRRAHVIINGQPLCPQCYADRYDLQERQAKDPGP